MSFSKIPPKSTNALPPIEPRKRQKASTHYGKDKVKKKVHSFSQHHLPPINERRTMTTRKTNNKSRSYRELLKNYEDLLEENVRNNSLRAQKVKEISEQITEYEVMLEETEEGHKELENIRKEHNEYINKLDEIDAEKKRVKIRQLEQGNDVDELVDENREMRRELRSLIKRITDVQARLDHGPDYVKGEIERFQREADMLARENEALEAEIEQKKSAESRDVKLTIEAEDSEDSDNPKWTSPRPEINQRHNLGRDTPRDLRLNLNDINGHVPLPPIHQKGPQKGKQKPKIPVLKPRTVLPAIGAAKQPEIKMNDSPATTQTALLPKPPKSGIPVLISRRRRIRRS